MALTPNNNEGRQYPLAAVVTFSDEDIKLYLPAGALVTGGSVVVTAASATGTQTATLKDDSGTPVSLMGNVGISATGSTPMPSTGLGMYYPSGAVLTFNAQSPDAKGFIYLEYVVVGRANEVFGLGT